MKKVLIADDSSFMRMLIRNILEKNNFSVVAEAENGKIALEKYKQLLPDIVTLDITMKVMTGLEALCEIVKFNPNAKAIMVSAMGQRMIIEEAVRLGAKGFLVKPFDEKVVVDTLIRVSNM